MKQIPMSQGQFVVVDDADYPPLSEFKWCFRGERGGKQGYAVRNVKADGKSRLCYIHRLLMQPKDGFEVIFLNHDRLDCRRENLKVVTKEESRQRHRVRCDSKTGAKGIRHNPENDTWSAYIYRHGHGYHVATYYTREQTTQAYEEALKRENPDLHKAPKRVERPAAQAPTKRSKPDTR